MATEILLIRHGQSTWNADRRWTGHADPALTSQGVEEARHAALSDLGSLGLQAVSSSPLRRARRTAEVIAAQLDLPLMEPLHDLRERNAGQWSGLTSAEIERRYPGMLEAWRSGEPIEIPGGEPWDTFTRRVIAAVGEAVREPSAHALLLVTHGGVLRAIADHLGEEANRWANLSGRWLRVEDGALSGGRRHPTALVANANGSTTGTPPTVEWE